MRGYKTSQVCEYDGIYRLLGHPDCGDFSCRELELFVGEVFPNCSQCNEKAQWYLSKTTEPVFVKQT